MKGGYAGKLLFVDLTKRAISERPLSDELARNYVGGYGIGARVLYEMMKPHTVSHGTSIVFNAMNYDDITDLRAEVELWIGGEKYVINKNFGAYIPPDVKQGPMIIRNIQKQIFYMMSYPVGKGVTKYRHG